jgi:hypothetical protein
MMHAMLAFAALVSIAQPSEQDVAEAKKYFEAGRAAYEATEYIAAARAFSQAHALAPRPAILFSMAQAYRQQYFLDRDVANLRRAIALYGQYLTDAEKGGRRNDAERFKRDLERELAQAEAKPLLPPAEPAGQAQATTQLMVSSRTPGAQISLDGGDPTAAPLIAEVEPGSHDVRVEAEGFVSVEVKQTAVEGRLVVAEINLAEKPAAVRVSAPDGAQVSVDGRYIGEAPLMFPIQLRSGAHFLAVTGTGKHAFVRELSVERGEELSIVATLESTTQRDVSYYFLGGGAVLFAVTGGFVIGALVAEGKARFIQRKLEIDKKNLSEAERDEYNDLRDLRGDLVTASSGLLAGSITLGLTGWLLYFFDASGVQTRKPAELEEPDDLTLVPMIGPDSIGASIGGSF